MFQIESVEPNIKEKFFSEIGKRIIDHDNDINILLSKRKKLEDKISYNDEMITKNTEFWNNKTESVKKSMIWIDEHIKHYIKNSNKKTLDLPNGIIRKRVTQTCEYPTNDIMLEFAKKNHIQYIITEKPNKKNILKYIKETGEIPEGFKSFDKTSITINSK